MISAKEAALAAFYLAIVVGKAHARQMDVGTRNRWRKLLQQRRSKTFEVPSWLWSSIVDLVAYHGRGYLEHCRRHALQTA